MNIKQIKQSARFNVRLTKKQAEILKYVAKTSKVSVSSVIRDALTAIYHI